MSNKEESPDENEKEEVETEPEVEKVGKKAKLSIKKEISKAKLTSKTEPRSEVETLSLEITDLLKKARAAIAEEQFLDAIKLYREAAITADMMGDSEREKSYLNRADEILKEHPELEKEFITEPSKKRKGKARLRKEEEKLTLSRLITQIIVAGIFIILVFSGLFSAIILQKLSELAGGYSYNAPMLWFICTVIEIIGLTIAYFFGTRWLKWPE